MYKSPNVKVESYYTTFDQNVIDYVDDSSSKATVTWDDQISYRSNGIGAIVVVIDSVVVERVFIDHEGEPVEQTFDSRKHNDYEIETQIKWDSQLFPSLVEIDDKEKVITVHFN